MFRTQLYFENYFLTDLEFMDNVEIVSSPNDGLVDSKSDDAYTVDQTSPPESEACEDERLLSNLKGSEGDFDPDESKV